MPPSLLFYSHGSAWLLASLPGLALAGLFFALWRRGKIHLALRTEKFNLQITSLDNKIFEAKKQLELTFDSITDGVAVIDSRFMLQRMNRSYAQLTGRDIQELLGEKCHQVLRGLPHPCPECPRLNTNFRDGFHFTAEGRKHQVELHQAHKAQNDSTFIETVHDLSRFEKMNEQLRRSERLATIGTMVAGVAHEMNNPLSGISGNSQLMLRNPEKYGLNPKGLERVQNVFQSARKATVIMEELLHFSMPGPIEFQRLNVAALIAATLASLEQSEFHPDHLEVEAPTDLYLWGDPTQLKDVLCKVLKNAQQAILDEKSNNPELAGRISVRAEKHPNGIVLEISDNGCGISTEKVGLVFDPFFTTREPGQGAGLGLSICYRIIREHHAQIHLVGGRPGTRVEMSFPLANPELTKGMA